jgi:dihydrofolate synthase / folylpolyglutamate synthase
MSGSSTESCSLARRETAMQFLDGRIDYERAQSMPCSEEAFKLDRMRELLRRLGNPQDKMAIVHVAGTKGKGSTSAMIAAMLSAAGYRTGLFTSPHLNRIEERIAINGQPCSAEELTELVERVRPHVEEMDGGEGRGARGEETAAPNPEIPKSPNPQIPSGPTYFEILTAMALDCFRRREVDAAVLEVGLGGRLDSTNVCSPRVSIITSISFDHTKQLGETLAAIAAEKGGIIKPGVPVISGVDADEPREVIRRIARQNGCRLVELGVDFDFVYHPPGHLERGPSPARLDYLELENEKPRPVVAESAASATTGRGFTCIEIGLLGRHQAANAAVALATIAELRQQGWTIPEAAIRRGLAEVVWPARVEVVARRPTVVLDAAHNVASVAALLEVLGESFSASRRLLIFATTLEKDHRGMLQQLLPRFDHIIFTRYSNNPRSVPPEELLALAEELRTVSPLPLGEGPGVRATSSGQWPVASGQTTEGREERGERRGTQSPNLQISKSPNSNPQLEVLATPAAAWDAIRRLATPDDLICITGSFFLASEMRAEIAARPVRSR